LVVHNYSTHYNHFEAERSLSEWMESQIIPGICGVDTRAITKLLRTRGSVIGKIIPADEAAKATPWVDPNVRNLIAECSITEPRFFKPDDGGDIDILAIDCGMKENIVRELVSRGARVKMVPWDWDITKEKYDGLFYSNGTSPHSLTHYILIPLPPSTFTTYFDSHPFPCIPVQM
jgi:carbamoylphosphate synthase small subunit